MKQEDERIKNELDFLIKKSKKILEDNDNN
jgi:hypothetical protein